MIERIPDMPAGTLGFRTTGAVTVEEFRTTVIPPVRTHVEGGRRLRLLVELGAGIEGSPVTAFAEEGRTGLDLARRHAATLERIAVVTDAEWVRRGLDFVGFALPGELRVFPAAQSAVARTWVAG